MKISKNSEGIGWQKENNIDGENVDLTSYAKKTDLPTKTSQLTNDSGYLTSIPSEYITETELEDKGYLTEVPSEYVTETELNAKGYLTEHQDISGKADKTYVDTELAKKSDTTHTHDQYLTEHQDLSDYALKTELPSVPTKTSQLTNDSGFITSIPNEYITETELNAKGYLTSTNIYFNSSGELVVTIGDITKTFIPKEGANE